MIIKTLRTIRQEAKKIIKKGQNTRFVSIILQKSHIPGLKI